MSDRPPGWMCLDKTKRSCYYCAHSFNIGRPSSLIEKANGCHKYPKIGFWTPAQMREWCCADFEPKEDIYDPAYGLE